MAKDKKKAPIVGDKFPSPEEARKAAGEIIKETEPEESASPEAEHNYKRTTILVDPELVRQMKVIAAQTGKFIYEVMNEAMAEYIEKQK